MMRLKILTIMRKQKKNLKKMRAHAAKEKAAIGGHNFFIALLALIWLIPVIWLVLVSFTGNLHGPSLSQFFPEKLSIENYAKLFTVINDALSDPLAAAPVTQYDESSYTFVRSRTRIDSGNADTERDTDGVSCRKT